MIIIKRDGRIQEYSWNKVESVVNKAFNSVNQTVSDKFLEQLKQSIDSLFKHKEQVAVEEMQDLIQKELIKRNKYDVVKSFILYRNKRAEIRESKSDLIKQIQQKLNATNIENQNANVDEASFGGRIGEAGRVVCKNEALRMMSEMSRENHLNNEIYIHDLDSYVSGMHNCLTCPIDDLLENGFTTRQTDVRPASSINTAMQLVAVIFQRHMSDIRKYIDKLKKAKGFSKFKELTYGNMTSLFSDLIYEKDGDLLFRNPWTDPEIETEEGREFLKYALEIINKDRLKNYSDREVLKNTNDVRYFRVPLAKASGSTIESMEGLVKAFKNKIARLDPRKWGLKKLLDKGELNRDDSELFEMNNMFNESDSESRLNRISQNGIDYFEKNLETLLIKHIFAYSQQEHINDVMPMAKASMVHLIVQGNTSNQKFENATQYIKDYIRNKIKNENINDSYPELWKAVGKLRNAASFLILAFNPVLYPGQLINGILQDIRIILQNRKEDDTPYTFKNLSRAWGILYKDMFKLGSKPTKCSLLNELLGMNDMDMNTYADKIKSDRYGIFNFTNIAFHCASRPDFFNRMSLLICQMIEEGTWDAYDIVDGKLVYNFKDDKRFAEYHAKTNTPEYYKQKALYEIMARQLINENALNSDGTVFKFGQDLPKAYTNKEIESKKSFIDTLYGYYTHEKKATIHAYWYGALWMQMRTFWSGKKNQYLGTAGVKLQGKYVHAKNSDGQELYYKLEDGKLIPTTEVTSLPILKWEGLWQEGIISSLIYLTQTIKEKGFKVTMDEIQNDPNYRLLYANLVLLTYDMMLFMLFAPMIAAMMGDWTEGIEKDAKKSGSIDDGIMATAARIALKTVNYGFLDFNFFESIGGPIFNVLPVALNYLTTRLSDLIDCIQGDKTFRNSLLKISSVTNLSRPLINNLFAE